MRNMRWRSAVLVPPELIVVSLAARNGQPAADAASRAPVFEPTSPEAAEPGTVATEPSATGEAVGADWTAPAPADDEDAADQREEDNEAAAAAAGALPMPSVALRRQRRAPSGLRRLVETLVGALLGIVIAYYALAICLGPRRFQEDVIERFGLPQLPLPFISAPPGSPAKEPEQKTVGPSPTNEGSLAPNVGLPQPAKSNTLK